jgi:demethylmenaquinone methyltransferase/2-methoxy-6-polyprenyl-1,4-benzoquinol methylase
MPDPVAVNTMFAQVAHRYDLANRVLSLGIDLWWRRRLVQSVRSQAPARVLDLATGSGDVAFALARGLGPGVRITGMDFCQPMLEVALAKQVIAGDDRLSTVEFVPGDGLNLPLGDGSFDAVTVAFGLRNMADRARALAEMRRVLVPGGRLHILEFSQPAAGLRPFYYFYMRRVSPLVAGWLTGEPGAYRYLCDSIAQFPDRAGLAAEIRAAGFEDIAAGSLTGGIVALHTARRPAS